MPGGRKDRAGAFAGSKGSQKEKRGEGKMKISVDADRMYAVSGEIRTVTDVLRANMDNLEFLVTDLQGQWQGEAERAYASRLVCVRREFRELERFFEEYASLLGRFAEEYMRCEEELRLKIANV